MSSSVRPVRARRFRARRWLTEPHLLVWVILAAILIVCSAATPLFLGARNLRNVFLVQPIGLGLASLGQAFVIISGGVDLSVGAAISLLTSLAAGVFSAQPQTSPFLVVLMLVAGGAVLGAVNGFVVVGMKVPPFMGTLATMSIFQGAVLFYAKRTIGGIPKSYRFISDGMIGPVPFSILYFILIIAIAYYVMNHNRFGKHLYAVGSDAYVSGLSGIRVQRMRFLAYVVCGILVGIAAVFMASRLGGGGPKVGAGYELDSITAVVIGGVSLAGGVGNVLGTFAGVLIIGVFSNIMNLLSVNAYLQIVLKGVVLIAAVSFYVRKKT